MDFFKTLRKKLESVPDRASDQRFWARFEREFGATKKAQKKIFWTLPKVASISAACLVALYFVFQGGLQSRQDEQALAAQLFVNQEMLEHMEALGEVDGAELSEDDWSLLLAGMEQDHG
jgi:hypothetical protein